MHTHTGVGRTDKALCHRRRRRDTMSTRHTNDSKARSLSPTTAALKLTNRMDLRLQLLLVCTAAAVTTAGLTA